MRTFILILLLILPSQIVRGQFAPFMDDTVPSYFLISSDTSYNDLIVANKPRQIPPKLNLLDSNSFFISLNSKDSDSIFFAIKNHLDEIYSLQPNRAKNIKGKKWKLLSIQDYRIDNPCCFPSSKFYNIYYFGTENLIFTKNQLLESFNSDNISWDITKRGEKFLTFTYSYRYIMNDSAEGGTMYIFMLDEDL